MRLIDADALAIVTRGKNHHRKYVFADITDAPTIDAIPVEWLKQQRERNDPESVKEINGAFVSICIDGVLVLWQKEQEAQDG